jgi:hypothetical protein
VWEGRYVRFSAGLGPEAGAERRERPWVVGRPLLAALASLCLASMTGGCTWLLRSRK